MTKGEHEHDWEHYDTRSEGMLCRCRTCGIRHDDAMWPSSSKGPTPIGAMDIEHLSNTIRYVKRNMPATSRHKHLLPALEHELRLRAKALGPGTKVEMFRKVHSWTGEVHRVPNPEFVALAGKVEEELERIKAEFNRHDNGSGRGPLAPPSPIVDHVGPAKSPVPELFTKDGLLDVRYVAERKSDGHWRISRSNLVREVNEKLKRLRMLEAERGPGIKVDAEPATCDVGADWED